MLQCRSDLRCRCFLPSFFSSDAVIAKKKKKKKKKFAECRMHEFLGVNYEGISTYYFI